MKLVNVAFSMERTARYSNLSFPILALSQVFRRRNVLNERSQEQLVTGIVRAV